MSTKHPTAESYVCLWVSEGLHWATPMTHIRWVYVPGRTCIFNYRYLAKIIFSPQKNIFPRNVADSNQVPVIPITVTMRHCQTFVQIGSGEFLQFLIDHVDTESVSHLILLALNKFN